MYDVFNGFFILEWYVKHTHPQGSKGIDIYVSPLRDTFTPKKASAGLTGIIKHATRTKNGTLMNQSWMVIATILVRKRQLAVPFCV